MRLLPKSGWRARHRIAQKLFWNDVGARAVRFAIGIERRFDTVVRNFSLIPDTNGEEWILSVLPETPTALDVGFFSGDFTAAILERRPAATVHTFDPSRRAIGIFEERFGSDERAHFHGCALADEPGRAAFFDYDNMCNSLSLRAEPGDPTRYEVEVETLDRWSAEHGVSQIDFAKIDAEGHDLHVLRGASALLRDQRIGVFMCEFSSAWIGSRTYLIDLVDFLEPLPYTLYRLFNGFLAPFEYDFRYDSAATLPGMYVGVSDARREAGDIPVKRVAF